ncbi:MAG: ribosomal biogenesis protein, partial [Pyrobaculum sp.]
MERGCQVAITTSRLPSKKTLELVNDLANSLPGCKKIARGKKSFATLLEEAAICGARYLAFVWDRRGMPSLLLFYNVTFKRWEPYLLKIGGVVTRRDFPIFVSRRPPARSAVIVDETGGELGDIFVEIFQYPKVYSLEKVRGRFDTIILVKRGEGYIVEILGEDLGPRASTLKIREVA